MASTTAQYRSGTRSLNNSLPSSANSSAASAITFGGGSNNLNVISSRQTRRRTSSTSPDPHPSNVTIFNVDRHHQDDEDNGDANTIIDVEVDVCGKEGEPVYKTIQPKNDKKIPQQQTMSDCSSTKSFNDSSAKYNYLRTRMEKEKKRFNGEENSSASSSSGNVVLSEKRGGEVDFMEETSFTTRQEEQEGVVVNHLEKRNEEEDGMEKEGKDDGSCNYIEPSEIEFNPSGISSPS